MSAYYNEIDPFAAQWLKNLISAGHITPGEVDTRSIEDVTATDLMGFTQCHFFAGIGGWSLALRLAGWPDDRPAWTGSCPCQPFSSAGKGAGFTDERHLWPAFFHLIRECAPGIVFGEQVASAVDWLDLISSDLEAEGYAFGATVLGAHSVGAPHIRQRIYWLANANSGQCNRIADGEGGESNRETTGRQQGHGESECDSSTGGVANADINGCGAPSQRELYDEKHHAESRRSVGDAMPAGLPLREPETVLRARGGA